MSLEASIYRFGDFTLDADQKVLFENGKPVHITPKALHLLSVLVECHGRIVEKEILLNEVWPDSFVEDSNLTFNIRQVRKILGDEKGNSRFIETVPRRGYRFVAEVTSSSNGISTNGRSEKPFRSTEEPSGRTLLSARSLVTGVILAFIGGVILVVLWVSRPALNAEAPILSADFASEKISTNGKVPHALISPDGKNAVYVVLNGRTSSVWLRQLESGNNVEIIPPSEDLYGGLAFSPDGNFLYVARGQSVVKPLDIIRTSILGGIPVKIAGDAQGWMSVSPNGSKISFVRCYGRDQEFCSLWVADSLNGGNERKLISRGRPIRIGANKISPDGKTIAFAVGQSENQANEFELAEVDIETGVERRITDEKFFNIKSLAWLPSGHGLLMTASRIPNSNFRIWQVSKTSGDVLPQTKDSESYSSVSLDDQGRVIVSTRTLPDFHLSLYPIKDPTTNHILADAMTAAFRADGDVIFSSTMTGNSEIWSISPNGSGRRQLSNIPADETAPVVSADSNLIFFASNRNGAVHVWRMNADGSNQVQITQNEGGFPCFVTPDGKWIYYHSGPQRTLWRVSADGRVEQEVFSKPRYRFAVSPDGTNLAYSEPRGEERLLTIMSLADRQITRQFRQPIEKAVIGEIAWLRDGRGLIYVLTDHEPRNSSVWLQYFDGHPARKLTELGDEDIESLAVSPDGVSFAIVKGRWKHDAVLISGLK